MQYLYLLTICFNKLVIKKIGNPGQEKWGDPGGDFFSAVICLKNQAECNSKNYKYYFTTIF
jgi:hypothetical protein